MDKAKQVGIVLLFGLVFCILWLVAVGLASSQVYEGRSVSATHRAYLSAKLDVRQAKARLSEARYVESATTTYTAEYGGGVGRWVWLARDVGWCKGDIPVLMCVISRESGGNPRAQNPTSTASGLLQFLAFHFDGSGDYGWRFDPFNPRQSLYYGLQLFKKQGWAPWALTTPFPLTNLE